MKKSIVKSLCFVLTLCMAISLLSGSAASEAAALYIGGVELDGGEDGTYGKNGDTVQSGATGTPDDFNAYYNAGLGVLTLKDAVASGANRLSDAGEPVMSCAIYFDGDLSIALEGDSIANGIAGEVDSYGVYVTGALTISGDGDAALTAVGGDVSRDGADDMDVAYSRAIRCDSLHIKSGAVNAAAGNAVIKTNGASARSCGVYTTRDIEITGGSLSTFGGQATSDGIDGAAAYSYGIYSYDGSLIASAGVLEATAEAVSGGKDAPDATTRNTGISIHLDIHISGSADVRANCSDVPLALRSFGIYAGRDLTLDGGSLQTLAGSCAGRSFGAYVGRSAYVNGGTHSFEAIGGAKRVYGLYPYTHMSVTGGEVIARAGDIAIADSVEGSYYISSGVNVDTLSIYGGRVVGIAGSVTLTGQGQDAESSGVLADVAMTIAGGSVIGESAAVSALTEKEEFTSGISAAEGTLAVFGGTLIAKTGLDTDPVILPAVYEWRNIDGGAYEQNSASAFVRSANGYTEIKAPDAPCSMANFTLDVAYDGFDDVDESEWYGTSMEGAVRDAVRLGLMEGYGDDKFGPEDELKISEAIKMACLAYSIYTGDGYDFVPSDPWYDAYVDYAIANRIIGEMDFTNYNATCTKAEAAQIFSKALPASEFVMVSELAPSDVLETDEYAAQINMLYAAGILRGNDEAGTFAGDTALTRSEAASIISRLAMPKKRV